MRIKKIHWSNLKGSSGSEDLAPVTLLTGPNFSGKTTRTDVIRLALLGFLPELGKSARATFGLSSGSAMSVDVEFDDGRSISRRWFLKGDTVKTEENVPEEIAKLGTLSVLLNASEYFSKGPTERRDYVAANCPLPPNVDHTPLGIAARVERVIGETVAWKVSLPVPSLQTYVEQNIAWFAEKAKASKDHADRMEETIRGLSGIRAADAPTTPLATLEARKTALEAERGTLQTVRTTLSTRAEASKRDRNRRETLTREIADRPAGDAKLARAEAEVRRLTDDIEMGQWPEPGRLEVVRQEENRFRTDEANRSTEFRIARRAQDEAAADLAAIETMTVCPFCGAVGDGWKGLRLAKLTTQLHAGEDQLSALTAAIAKAQAGRKAAEREAESIMAENKRLEALRGQLEGAKRQAEAIRSALAVLRAREEELAAMPPAPEVDATAIREAEDGIARLDASIREIETLRKTALGRANDLQRLAQAEADRDKVRREETTFKAAGKELKAIQAELVASAFGPLLKIANGLFGSILKTPLAYNEDRAELGTWRGGVWVSHLVHSGVEQLLVYGAIQIALASRSPFALLIMDELGRLDPENARKFYETVAAAVADGKIGQFVGIAPDFEFHEMVNDDFKVFRVGA